MRQIRSVKSSKWDRSPFISTHSLLCAKFLHASTNPCQDLKIGFIFRALCGLLAARCLPSVDPAPHAARKLCQPRSRRKENVRLGNLQSFLAELSTQSTVVCHFGYSPSVLLDTVAWSNKCERYPPPGSALLTSEINNINFFQ